MSNLLTLMPNLEPDELNFVQMLLKDADDNKQQQFAMIYNSRRKDPQTILLLTLIGFITAYLSALVVIKWFINYLQKKNLEIFGYYRIVIGLLILWSLL